MDKMQSEIHALLRDWAVAEAKANNKRLKAQMIKLQRVIIFAGMVVNPVLVQEKFSELLNLVDSDLAKIRVVTTIYRVTGLNSTMPKRKGS